MPFEYLRLSGSFFLIPLNEGCHHHVIQHIREHARSGNDAVVQTQRRDMVFSDTCVSPRLGLRVIYHEDDGTS